MVREIVAQVKADFKVILEQAASAPAGTALAAVEFAVRERAHKAYGAMLRDVLLLVTRESWRRVAAPTCRCGHRMRMVRRQSKTVVTVVGPITIERRQYYCDRCRSSRRPFDAYVGLDGSGFSDGARRLICRSGSVESFREASDGLRELAGIRVSHEAVRRVSEGVAHEVVEAQCGGALCGEEDRLDFTRDRAVSRAYVSMDGTMVNTQGGWREAKLGALYSQSKAQQHFVATLSASSVFGSMMRRHAAGVGALSAQQRIVIGDGAPWIWRQSSEQFPGATEVVDYYHLIEQVWRCTRGLYGETDPRGTAWTSRRLKEIREIGPGRLIASLRRSRRRRRDQNEQAALDGLLGYVVARRDRLRYPTFRKRDIDIGSGPVESACRHVIARRLKGSGMRWREENAEAMLRLRALSASAGPWKTLWQRHHLAA